MFIYTNFLPTQGSLQLEVISYYFTDYILQRGYIKGKESEEGKEEENNLSKLIFA